MIDKSMCNNEKHDKRYESLIGSEVEWIKSKLNNGPENIRDKDLEDFLKYIEDLESHLKHRTEMFHMLNNGGKLFITKYGKTAINIKTSHKGGMGFSEDNFDFIYVSEDPKSASLVDVTSKGFF